METNCFRIPSQREGFNRNSEPKRNNGKTVAFRLCQGTYGKFTRLPKGVFRQVKPPKEGWLAIVFPLTHPRWETREAYGLPQRLKAQESRKCLGNGRKVAPYAPRNGLIGICPILSFV